MLALHVDLPLQPLVGALRAVFVFLLFIIYIIIIFLCIVVLAHYLGFLLHLMCQCPSPVTMQSHHFLVFTVSRIFLLSRFLGSLAWSQTPVSSTPRFRDRLTSFSRCVHSDVDPDFSRLFVGVLFFRGILRTPFLRLILRQTFLAISPALSRVVSTRSEFARPTSARSARAVWA